MGDPSPDEIEQMCAILRKQDVGLNFMYFLLQ